MSHKPDPYCQFKSDDYRHRALRFRVAMQCLTVVVVAVVIAITPADRWLQIVELLRVWRIWPF